MSWSTFYVLGPLVTDVAPGYDHTLQLLGCYCSYLWSRFHLYLTPAEHLRLPNLDDMKEGIISKIAAHAEILLKELKMQEVGIMK